MTKRKRDITANFIDQQLLLRPYLQISAKVIACIDNCRDDKRWHHHWICPSTMLLPLL